MFHELSKKYSGSVSFEEIDIYEDPQQSSKFEVQVTPTFLVLDASGKEVDRLVGARPEQELVDAIEKAIK